MFLFKNLFKGFLSCVNLGVFLRGISHQNKTEVWYFKKSYKKRIAVKSDAYFLVVKNNHAVCSFHCQIIKFWQIYFSYLFYFCSTHGDCSRLITISYEQMEKLPLCIRHYVMSPISAGKWQSCYQNSSPLTCEPGILVLALWFFSGRWPSPSHQWRCLTIDNESQEGKEKDTLRGRGL